MTSSTPGTYTIVVTITDAVDPSLVDSRTLVVRVQSPARRELAHARRSTITFPTLFTSFKITNGVLAASLGNQQIGSENNDPSKSNSATIAIAGGVGAACVIVAAVIALVVRRSSDKNKIRAGSIDSATAIIEFANVPAKESWK